MYYKPRQTNLISLSTAPANIIIGKQYYDLLATIDLMKYMQQRGSIDGFEFQLLEEWDENAPPLDDKKRVIKWYNSQKYSVETITNLIKNSSVNILSIHAKRDIGVCLCSNNSKKVEIGKRLIDETLYFANQIGSNICVFHIWDTWKEEINIDFLYETLKIISLRYPNIKASVENVPTHAKGCTPFELVKNLIV